MSEKNLSRPVGVDSSVTDSELHVFNAYNRLADRRIVSAEVRKYGLSPKTLKNSEINAIAAETSISLDNNDAARVRSAIEQRMIAENVSDNVLQRFAWRFQHDAEFRTDMLRYASYGFTLVSVAFLVGCTMASGEQITATQPADSNPTFTPNPSATHLPTMEASIPPTFTPSPTTTPDGRVATMVAQATEASASVMLTPNSLPTREAAATQSHLNTREALLNHTPESTATSEIIASPTPNFTPERSLDTLDTTVNLSLPDVNYLVYNHDGIDYAYYESRRAYLSQLVDARNPELIDDEDRAFDAQWLGRDSDTPLTTDKRPNFFNWRNGGFGRGWDRENVLSHYLESNTAFRDLEHGQHFWNNPETGLNGAAFESRFESIRQDLATIAVHYYLDNFGNDSVWDSEDSLHAFLDQYNAQILALEDQLFSTMGIEPLVEGRAMRAGTRPTAWQTFIKDVPYQNYLLEESTVCVTYMGDASERANQMEQVVRAEVHSELEAQTLSNDTTLTRADLREQTEVFVTYDETGRIVVDVVRVANIPDPLNPDHLAPNDNQNGAEGAGLWGRLIPCGTAVAPVLSETSTPDVSTPVPVTPGTTPGESTRTPSVTPSNEPSVTPASTNVRENTPTGEPESSPTRMPTSTSTRVPTQEATVVTRTPQSTPTESFPSETPTRRPSHTPTLESTATRQPTATMVPTQTRTPVPTFTQTVPPSETPRPTDTLIPPSNTPTREPSVTPAPTNQVEPTISVEPPYNPTLIPTSTPTAVPTEAATTVPRTEVPASPTPGF